VYGLEIYTDRLDLLERVKMAPNNKLNIGLPINNYYLKLVKFSADWCHDLNAFLSKEPLACQGRVEQV
jgi:hypothetical protein